MGKPHGNSRLAKIGIPVLRRKPKGGAPKGNRNGRKHGAFSAEARARREEVRALLRETEELIAHIEAVGRALREAGEDNGRCISATRYMKVTD
jgi:uncharacterized protein YjcR